MHVISVPNVFAALPEGVRWLLLHGEKQSSRAGEVLVARTPVTTVYSQPQYRVLLSPVRDANPYFHLLEAMWMLDGRKDAAFLNNYVKDFGDRFAEIDGDIHGAYGSRWRRALSYDQLDVIVEKLSYDPQDRQAVLQMWDGSPEGENDLCGNWKDRPCNTHVYFRVRDMGLDMTVCCRSNDIIWGAYGANAVHMGFLQEYVAGHIGVEVGTYYQVSNNYHAYTSELERLAKRGECEVKDLPDKLGGWNFRSCQDLVNDPVTFDEDLDVLMDSLEELHQSKLPRADAPWHRVAYELNNKFLSETVWRAALAHRSYRLGNVKWALDTAKQISAPDWSLACTEWLERRITT